MANVNDLAEEMARFMKPTICNPEGAYTTRELAEKLGISANTVRDRLHKLKAQGLLRHCRVERKAGLNDALRVVDAYILEGSADAEEND